MVWLGALWSLTLCMAPAQAQGLKASPRITGMALPNLTHQVNGPQTADYIVAVVNSEPVTNQEVQTRLLRVQQQFARNPSAAPPKQEMTHQVLESLIVEKAQLQLAAESGIKVDDAALNDAESNVARQNQLTVAQMHDKLTAQGLTVSEFRSNLRQQLLIQRLREREVDGRIKVTDADVDRFVAQKQDSPGSDLQIQIAQVLVAVPDGADAKTLATLMSRAQLVGTKARAGEDFAALAREYSDAPDRTAGGSLGLRPADRYPVLFTDATRGLQPGGVVGPVRSPAGFHILKLLDRRIAGMPEPVMGQTHARHILLRPTAQLSEQAAVARLVEFKRQIEAGKTDFATLAREFSQDTSAKEGGDLGWMPAGVFVPEFEDVMNHLGPGQISEPVVSRFGVHLIEVLERREVKLSPSEQREQLRQMVREQKLDEAYGKWLEEIRSRAYVEFRDPPQ
jgi:peptidyl-prolyl cis-trans isomerase SurA